MSSPVKERRVNRALIITLVLLIFSGTQTFAQEKWEYSAFGDSLATGVLALKGYVPRYRDYIKSDARVSVTLYDFGQNGWTSGELLEALRHDSIFRSSLLQSEVVTWNIGGNDLRDARTSYKARTCGGSDNQDCLRAAVATFKVNRDSIIVEILSVRGTSNTIVRTMDIYNPYVNADKASNAWPDDLGSDFQVFKFYLDAVNTHIAMTANSYGIPYAKVYAAFNGVTGDQDPKSKSYIAFDNLHPNDRGHKAIADLLRKLRYAPLR